MTQENEEDVRLTSISLKGPNILVHITYFELKPFITYHLRFILI